MFRLQLLGCVHHHRKNAVGSFATLEFEFSTRTQAPIPIGPSTALADKSPTWGEATVRLAEAGQALSGPLGPWFLVLWNHAAVSKKTGPIGAIV